MVTKIPDQIPEIRQIGYILVDNYPRIIDDGRYKHVAGLDKDRQETKLFRVYSKWQSLFENRLIFFDYN